MMKCTNSVLDSSYPGIKFDKNGVSNIFKQSKKIFEYNFSLIPKKKELFLNKTIKEIKESNSLNGYNCILGLSGGLDSSYMLHKVVNEYGLKPLVFHVDAGWNSEIAVNNIEKMINKLNLDLFTEVINWKDVKNLQKSFFESGVPHIDIPQDHAFVSILYKYAEKYKIKFILNGGNIFNEIVPMPYLYYYWGTDLRQIFDIFNKFSNEKLKSYPFSSVFRHKIFLRYIKSLKVIKPLNFEIYKQDQAEELLGNEYQWRPYKQKHFESNFTRFYEGYWLLKRFNFDVRKCQLTSLIISNQITIKEANKILEKPPLNAEEVKNDFNYICNKLGYDSSKLYSLEKLDKKFYFDYKNTHKILKPIELILKILKLSVRGGAF